MKYTVFFGYAKKMSEEATGVRYAIPSHRKEGLTVAESEEFVAKQLGTIGMVGMVQAANVQRLVGVFRQDNVLVAENRMYVRVPEPTLATVQPCSEAPPPRS